MPDERLEACGRVIVRWSPTDGSRYHIRVIISMMPKSGNYYPELRKSAPYAIIPQRGYRQFLKPPSALGHRKHPSATTGATSVDLTKASCNKGNPNAFTSGKRVTA